MAANNVNVELFLQNQKSIDDDDISNQWQIIEKFYQKKLWHQLTVTLTNFLKTKKSQESDVLLEIYDNFLVDFEHILNPLALAEIVVLIVQKMRLVKKPSTEIIAFVDLVKEKVFMKALKNKDGDLAVLLADLTKGMVYLEDVKDTSATRKIVEETEQTLSDYDCVTAVHDRYFFLSSTYHRTLGNHAEYYREALRYLGCTTLESMSLSDQQNWAFTIGVAAILGKGVYNFGELLMHDVIKSLDSAPDKTWIVDILFAFNKGDISKFNDMKPKWSSLPDLLNQETFLREKITLMCLIELAFCQPTTQRLMSFKTISSAARVPEDKVEFLLMKALSLDLIRGKINEIDKCVLISWVQPRVLDIPQIQSMQQKNSGWVTSVAAMEDMVSINAKDILG